MCFIVGDWWRLIASTSIVIRVKCFVRKNAENAVWSRKLIRFIRTRSIGIASINFPASEFTSKNYILINELADEDSDCISMFPTQNHANSGDWMGICRDRGGLSPVRSEKSPEKNYFLPRNNLHRGYKPKPLNWPMDNKRRINFDDGLNRLMSAFGVVSLWTIVVSNFAKVFFKCEKAYAKGDALIASPVI